MSNTITKRDTDCLAYSNNEHAFFIIEGAYLASSPKNSSAVQFWSYDIANGTLTVQYKSSPTFYRYESVPFQVIFDLMLADSLGQFIAKVVKPNYSVA
jgi:hypothetical protein